LAAASPRNAQASDRTLRTSISDFDLRKQAEALANARPARFGDLSHFSSSLLSGLGIDIPIGFNGKGVDTIAAPC
jgi:hypothetical protein